MTNEANAGGDKLYMRKPEVIHSAMPDRVLALHIETGNCFAFGGPSARLWDLLEQPLTAAEAARRLVQEYEIEEEACRAQVSDHLHNLHAEGLISIVDAKS